MLFPETWRSITFQGDVLAAIESGAKPSQTSAQKEAVNAPAKEGKETAVEAKSQKEAGRPGR